MANELTVNKGSLLAVVEEKSLGELLESLTREIYLFNTYIAGTSYIKDTSIFDDLQEGDRLKLRREDNKFDTKAILVLDPSDRKLGYIPEKDNQVFARLMDAGKLLIAKVETNEKKDVFRTIRIGIYLVDY